MPRTARASRGGICYHAINRGNARQRIFHCETDYRAFVELLQRAGQQVSMRILAWCLMPNHFHLVVRPYGDGDLGRWMHWLLTSHVQRHRRVYKTTGRIWQGRYRAPPVQEDRHLLTVMRYAERNPLRAGLVQHAEDWPWSSLRERIVGADGLICAAPVSLPADWREWVNEPLTASEIADVRQSLRRGRPFGDAAWVQGTAERLGLESSLRPVGRPRIRMR